MKNLQTYKHQHTKKFSVITIFLVMAFSFQCQTDQSFVEPAKSKSQKVIWKDGISEDLAKRLASALRDQKVSEFLKAEAVKKFDGDFDILFVEASQKIIENTSAGKSITFGQILFDEKSTDNGKSSDTYIGNFIVDFPLLQISIPALPNNQTANTWDAEKTKPLVAYVPSETEDDIIPAFDSDGKKYNLSRKTPPKELVIVISENERLFAIPKAMRPNAKGRTQLVDECPALSSGINPYYSTESVDYYYRADYYEMCECCGGGGGGGGGEYSHTSCDRDHKTSKDYLVKMKFNSDNDLDYAEEWINGAPELRVVITFGATTAGGFSNLSKSPSKLDRSKYKDCGLFSCKPEWASINLEILTWNKVELGDKMKYTWLEEDSGDAVEATVNLSTSFKNEDGTTTTVTNSVKYTKTDKDDFLGESIVEYCDNTDDIGTSYNTGKLQFYVNQN